MIRRRVVLSQDALDDLIGLYRQIAEAASPETALAFVERVEAYLARFDVASERGTRRDDIRPGVRMIGFERRLTVTFRVTESEVTILRVFYGGQDWPTAL